MKCEDIQLLLIHDELGSDAQAHIEKCDDCRKYRQDMEMIMQNPNNSFEPGPELDKKVLDFAKVNRPSKKKPIPFFVWTAVAAAAIILFAVTVMNKEEVKGTNPGKEIVKDGVIKEKETDSIPKKKMMAQTPQLEDNVADPIQDIFEDDFLNAEMSAIEGEMFVLSSELYE